ncbi:MAG: LamG-like jellyroll fold domain-containing protein [Chloroflexota bacterium]
MQKRRYFRLSIIVLLLITLSILHQTALATAFFHSLSNTSTRPTTSQTPEQVVQQAWEFAQVSGSYEYRSQLEQITYPAPSLSSAGRDKQVHQLFVEGSIDQPNEKMELSLWENSGGVAEDAIQLRVEEGRAYGRFGSGEWEEVDNIADMFAPTGDPLGFLASATNIQQAETKTQQFSGTATDPNASSLTYTGYTFDYDGAAFADFIREQVEAQMQQRGELPAGISLESPQVYREATGQGEIWLDANSLPRILTLQLELGTLTNGDRVIAHIQNEYFAYDETRIEQSQTTVFENPRQWATYQLTPSLQFQQQLLINGSLLLVVLLLGYLAYRSRRTQSILAIFIVFSMLFSPLIRSQNVAAFYENQHGNAEAESEQEAQQQVQENYETYRARFNPHQDPLASPAPQNSASTLENNALSSTQSSQALANAPQNSSADTDGDGLTDEAEQFWGTCAQAADCPTLDPTDSDGDGLTDGQEVNNVGTIPTLEDTDGDTIKDGLEVAGFVYASTTWYLDPFELDSNKDGIDDGLECEPWRFISASHDETAVCPDTDRDGEPDVFDSDNDGDGVPDSVDLSPFTADKTVYSEDNLLNVNFANLTMHEPVFMDVQMVPTNRENITLFGNVLDWPSGDDQGQIQRVLNTTWANTSDTNSRSTSPNASFGDVRLVPMLEVAMPYGSGHYANLPLKAAYQNTSRNINTPVDDWLDKTKLDPYGIVVQDATDNSGDLVAYLPVSLVQDSDGGGNVAFAARMLYWPMQGSNNVATWGQDQQLRLVWFVQMLTDKCPENNPSCAANQRVEDMSLVHIYDDSWQLAGLEVTEDRGLDVGILYEDPTRDNNLNLDDQLWATSWMLSNTFMRGRDCPALNGSVCDAGAQDGQRDVTIANVRSAIDGWSGNDNYLNVETFSYDHEGHMAHIMMTETEKVLDNRFSAYASQTDPTLMFMQERKARTVNLDNASLSNSRLAMNFTTNAAPEVVVASLNWSTYFGSSGNWKNYHLQTYVENLLDAQLQADDFFLPTSAEQEAIDEADGKRIWAQIYYAAMFYGTTAVVELNGTTVWSESADAPEVNYSPEWPQPTFSGASYVATTFLSSIRAAFTARQAGSNFFAQLKQTFTKTYAHYTAYTRDFKSSHFRNVTNGLAVFTVTFIAVGAVIFAIGYFTNDAELLTVATIILNVGTVIILTSVLASTIHTLVKLFKIFAVTSALPTALLLSKVSKAARFFGQIGVIVQFLVIWGFFAYAILSGEVHVGTTEFEVALALAIAQTIVLAVLILIELALFIVGTIFIILLFIIDAILALAGEKGLIERLTEALAKDLYDIDFLIENLNDPNRLHIEFTDVALETLDDGFAVGNGFFATMRVTTTLDVGGDIDDGRRATFRYFLEDSETNHHSTLSQNDMRDDWSSYNGDFVRAEQTVVNSDAFPFTGPGINRDLAGEMYLNEGAVLPYEGCWKITIVPRISFRVKCTWYDRKTTNYIEVGQHQVYDILPATVEAFAKLNWSIETPFPIQHDLDNDGIKSTQQNGTDPDDTKADTDGDGLTDPFEQIVGTDPTKADTDGDGLTDKEELNYFTNPHNPDTDGDGLDDYTETKVGWLIVYEWAGSTPKLTRVWSDPNIADADNDKLSDLEEFTFGFNPWVKTDPSLIDSIVAFDNIQVTEANAATLLLQFEEDASVQGFFGDSSGLGKRSHCDDAANACPQTGSVGQHGNGVAFDGANDRIEVDAIDLTNKSFTIAGWANWTGNNNDLLFQHGGTDTAYEHLSGMFFSDNNFICDVGGSDFVQTTNTFASGEWHHWACVYEAESQQLSAYVNGQYQDSVVLAQAYQGNGILEIGGRNSETFNGLMDDVALFETAVSPQSLLDLMNGRYQLNDLIVAPGDALRYGARIANNHPSQPADGYLSASTFYQDPNIGVPDLVLGFEASEMESTFADSAGQSSTATCFTEVTCPETAVGGAFGAAVRFDGVDDTVMLPTTGEGYDQFALAFWLNVAATPTEDVYILDTESTAPGALDVVLNSNGNVEFRHAGLTKSNDFRFAGDNLNQWVHVSLLTHAIGGSVYINAGQDGNGTSWGQHNGATEIIVGPGRIGNSIDGTAAFAGSIDEMVFYNRRIASPSATNNPELLDVFAGRYWINYQSYSAKTPTLLLKFDDVGVDYAGDIFPDSQQGGNHAYCESSGTCPTVVNNAAVFDGVDDYAAVYGTKTQHNYDINFSLRLDQMPAPGEYMYLFDTASADDPDHVRAIDIFVRDGRLRVSPGPSSPVLLPGVTYQFRIVIGSYIDDGSPEYGGQMYINGVHYDDGGYCPFSDAPRCDAMETRFGPGRMGSSLAGDSHFMGTLDEANLGIGTYSFDLDFNEIGFINRMNDGVVGHCVSILSCPDLDTNGAFGGGIQLDGADDFLLLDPMDFVVGDYTASFWFKSTASTFQPIVTALDAQNSGLSDQIVLTANGAVQFTDRFFPNSGEVTVSSNAGYNDGAWHHVVAIKSGNMLNLYVDGALATAGGTQKTEDGLYDIQIGRGVANDHFAGSLDELIIIPSAATDGDQYALVDALRLNRYPAIGIDADFTPFNITALTATGLQETAVVEQLASSSYHGFDVELEAALQLQSNIDYPISDGAVANLTYFLPFEEVPNNQTFLNISPLSSINFTCSADHCPTTGHRGKVGRAVLFDGVNDVLLPTVTNTTNVYTIAAWVKGDRGTILDTKEQLHGMELDFNRFHVFWDTPAGGLEEWTINFDLPENQWTHLVATYNRYDEMKVYVNGQLVGTETTNPAPSWLPIAPNTIGTNVNSADPLHGYLDDLRLYNTVLSAGAIQTLYLESAAQLRFEFDEDEHAGAFFDASNNGYVGQPSIVNCYDVVVDSVTVNSLATEPSSLAVNLGNGRLGTLDTDTSETHALNYSTVLCQTENLSVSVLVNDSETTLGSIPINPTTAGTFNSNLSSGGNSVGISWTVAAEPIEQYNPTPGTDGRIGNTALFDGNGYIEVADADAVTSLSNNFTIVGWIRPEDIAAATMQIMSSGNATNNTGFSFRVNNQQLTFQPHNGSELASTSQLDMDKWQHVAIVLDGGNNVHFYVDGVLTNSLPATAISTSTAESLIIGALLNNGTASEQFHGQIDELAVYKRALSGAELFSIYLRELRWYRDRRTATVRVDADNPSIELLTTHPYHANAFITLAATATDPSSHVARFEYGLQGPADSEMSWQLAPRCQNDVNYPTAAYCLQFDATQMGGEGSYQFQFRAIDQAGNETLSQLFTHYVDDTGPTVTVNGSGQWVQANPIANKELAWTAPIAGTVADPQLNNGVAGSGILVDAINNTQTVAVTLYDSNGDVAGDGTQLADVVNGNWALDYGFNGRLPQGTYTIQATAYDKMGNLGQSDGTSTIRLDARPPAVELANWSLPETITSSLTLDGTVIELVDPAGALAQYHFEEMSGTTFYDHSYSENHATCIDCPTLGHNGQFGKAVGFAGVNDVVVTPSVIDPSATPFSASVWFNVADLSQQRVILSQENGVAWLALDTNGRLLSSLGGVDLVGETAVSLNQWHHAALTFDGTTLSLYLDGGLEKSEARTPQANNGTHLWGAGSFSGLLDEASLYGRVLSAAEIYALAQGEAIGIKNVEVAIEPYSFEASAELSEPTAWETATGVAAISELSAWQYTLPEIDGYYTINLRATDDFDNVSGVQRPWRGIIDTKAPDIDFDVTFGGFGNAASRTYTFTIRDSFLYGDSLSHACGNSPVSVTYTYHPVTEQLEEMSGSCRVLGHGEINEQVSISACDVYEHCTTETLTLIGEEPGNSVLIRVPQKDAILEFTGANIPIEIGGFGWFGNIESLTIADQNGIIDTISYTEPVFDVIWQTNNWNPPTHGVYTLTATQQLDDGSTQTDVITVTLTDDATIELSMSSSGQLSWLPESGAGCTESLYQETNPYAETYQWIEDGAPWDYDTTASLASVGNNYFYYVTVDCGAGVVESNRVGEFTFAIVPGE